MSIPKFHEFAAPILTYLHDKSEPQPIHQIHKAMAAWAKLTKEELSTTMSSGKKLYIDRISWALTYLKKAKWIECPERAIYIITTKGKQRTKSTKKITSSELYSYARPTRGSKKDSEINSPKVVMQQDITPREQIESAIKVLEQEICDELLIQLKGNSPEFFEKCVLETLKSMGYAGENGSIKHSGKSGDGGIDGIIYLDRLGLERVHIQAKRWGANVSEPTVRDFAGAMDIRGATKGVIISTSDFTQPAKVYSERSPKMIRLVSGYELASLMVEFGIGVSHQKKIIIPSLDLDFFEE